MAENDNSLKFTKSRLEALPVPPTGRAYYRDTATSGLQLCIMASGTKTFYFRRKIAGRSQRFLVGRFPAVTIDEARKIASGLAVSVAKGSDPQADRRRQRGEPTIADLQAAWVDHAKGRKRSWKEDERVFGKYIAPGWSSRRLSSITTQEVSAWHRKTGKEYGQYQANRALALLRSAYNAAAQLVGFNCQNPAKGVKGFKEQSRERYIGADELPRFFEALASEPNEVFRDFVWLALLTGARRDNVASMEWRHLDLDRGLWSIPADSAKAGQRIIVPLVPQAVTILRARTEAKQSDRFVFPANSKAGYLTEPKHGWRRLLERARIENLRIHDVRHTLASWLAIGGESLPIIGKLLGHGSTVTTARYSHLSTDPVRAALIKATDTILELAKPVEQPKQ